MSLFENDEYQWRETYFVLFDKEKRPTAEQLETLLKNLNKAYDIRDVRSDEQGMFESLTLISTDDYAAMDLTCAANEEILDQIQERFSGE